MVIFANVTTAEKAAAAFNGKKLNDRGFEVNYRLKEQPLYSFPSLESLCFSAVAKLGFPTCNL